MIRKKKVRTNIPVGLVLQRESEMTSQDVQLLVYLEVCVVESRVHGTALALNVQRAICPSCFLFSDRRAHPEEAVWR